MILAILKPQAPAIVSWAKICSLEVVCDEVFRIAALDVTWASSGTD
jgi:hypothetical protein